MRNPSPAQLEYEAMKEEIVTRHIPSLSHTQASCAGR